MYGASAGDDGLSPLTPERYLELRIGDQLGFYQPKTASLERQLRRLQLAAIAAGGGGTFLAAVGLEIWVGLSAAVAGAAFACLGYLQIDATIVAYNQAATRLEALVTWWHSLPEAERDSESFSLLVERAESVLQTEQGTWVQQMSEALEQLAARQRKSSDGTESTRRPDGRASRGLGAESADHARVLPGIRPSGRTRESAAPPSFPLRRRS